MKGFAKGKEDEQAGEINLTPMLDVVFILLIFFIVTSVFVKEAGYEINYPEASQVEGVDGEPILYAPKREKKLDLFHSHGPLSE